MSGGHGKGGHVAAEAAMGAVADLAHRWGLSGVHAHSGAQQLGQWAVGAAAAVAPVAVAKAGAVVAATAVAGTAAAVAAAPVVAVGAVGYGVYRFFKWVSE